MIYILNQGGQKPLWKFPFLATDYQGVMGIIFAWTKI